MNFLFLTLVLALITPLRSEATTLSNQTTEAPPSESPTCEIQGIVSEINEKNGDLSYYDVKLKITGIAGYKPSVQEAACNENYSSQIEKAGQILFKSEYDTTPIKKGDSIKALVVFSAENTLAGYFLHDIQVTQENQDVSASNQTLPNPVSIIDKDYSKIILASVAIVAILILLILYRYFKKKKRTVI